MTIYLDSEFKCHVADGGGMVAIETDFFDDKCDAYIEGYRYVPEGKTWTRSDGVEFTGVMVAPWKLWDELDDAQRAYERERYQAMAAENATLSEENETLTAENATLSVALDELDAEYQKGVDSL